MQIFANDSPTFCVRKPCCGNSRVSGVIRISFAKFRRLIPREAAWGHIFVRRFSRKSAGFLREICGIPRMFANKKCFRVWFFRNFLCFSARKKPGKWNKLLRKFGGGVLLRIIRKIYESVPEVRGKFAIFSRKVYSYPRLVLPYLSQFVKGMETGRKKICTQPWEHKKG